MPINELEAGEYVNYKEGCVIYKWRRKQIQIIYNNKKENQALGKING